MEGGLPAFDTLILKFLSPTAKNTTWLPGKICAHIPAAVELREFLSWVHCVRVMPHLHLHTFFPALARIHRGDAWQKKKKKRPCTVSEQFTPVYDEFTLPQNSVCQCGNQICASVNKFFWRTTAWSSHEGCGFIFHPTLATPPLPLTDPLSVASFMPSHLPLTLI